MDSTLAVVNVDQPVALVWLGHMPVVNWILAQLAEVRSLQRTVVLTIPELAEPLRQYVRQYPVLSRPATLPAADLEAYLWSASGPAAEADIVLLVEATNPFVQAATMELCLREARTTAPSVLLGRPCRVVNAAARPQPAFEALPQVRALRRSQSAPAQRPPAKLVPVGTIESLSVADPEQLCLAQALVSSGIAT
jgi:2-C-methyl-D-erythritol 4-phosphate cytidylyltransferase